MASVLVGYVRLKVFTLITLTMSPCDERRFLELNLVDITHRIFPSVLMRSYWTKHVKSKWLTKMQGTKSLPKHMASRVSLFSVAFPQYLSCKGNPLTPCTPSHTERLRLPNAHTHRTPALTEHLHSSNTRTHRTPTLTERSPDRMPMHS